MVKSYMLKEWTQKIDSSLPLFPWSLISLGLDMLEWTDGWEHLKFKKKYCTHFSISIVIDEYELKEKRYHCKESLPKGPIMTLNEMTCWAWGKRLRTFPSFSLTVITADETRNRCKNCCNYDRTNNHDQRWRWLLVARRNQAIIHWVFWSCTSL